MRSGAATEAELYEIKVRGHVRAHRLRAFDRLNITHEASGETTIAVRIADQAALYGLLVRIRDLGVSLVSVRCVECAEDRADGPAHRVDAPADGADEPAHRADELAHRADAPADGADEPAHRADELAHWVDALAPRAGHGNGKMTKKGKESKDDCK